MAAAVGSLTMRRTLRPAMVPASLVACRWASFEVGGNGDDGVGDLVAEVSLCGLLHLLKDHGGDLLGGEGLLVAVDVDLDGGLAVLLDELEGEVLGVLLEVGLAPLAADETLGVEDGVLGVLCGLVLAASPTRRSGVNATYDG